jgi:hypothetical protein
MSSSFIYWRRYIPFPIAYNSAGSTGWIVCVGEYTDISPGKRAALAIQNVVDTLFSQIFYTLCVFLVPSLALRSAPPTRANRNGQ